MKRAITAVMVAAAMVAVGGLGFSRGPEPGSRTAPLSATSAALLGPGGFGGLDGTIASLQARLSARPADWGAQASLGLAYLQKGRISSDPSYYPKADRLLGRSLLDGGEQNFEAALGMGLLSLGRHDFAGALRWGRQAREANPDNAEARGVIGDALLELGRYPAAARAYQVMIDLRPEISSYARVSYYRELHGDVPGAIRAMGQALASAGTPEDVGWAGYQLGELHFGRGRLSDAAAAYRAAGAADPGAVLPRIGTAKVAAARGELDRAARILVGVVERYPSPEAVILLGDVQVAAGQSEDARRSYALVRAMDRLYRAGGVDTDLEMALFAADHGIDVEEGLDRARAAYRRRPSVQAADALAWVMSATGRHRAAMRLAREALRLGTRSASFHFHAGMIAFRLGDGGVARRHLRTALRIAPAFHPLQAPEARRALNALGGP